MGSCQLPSWEIHSGGQPWTPPNHWPTDAFWLIISSSLDSVLWPRVSQALCGESLSVWVDLCPALLACHSSANTRKEKGIWNTWGPESNRSNGGHQADSTLLSQNNFEVQFFITVVCIICGFRWSNPVSHPLLFLKHNNALCCLSVFHPFYNMSTAGTWLIKIPFTEALHTQHASPFLFSQWLCSILPPIVH